MCSACLDDARDSHAAIWKEKCLAGSQDTPGADSFSRGIFPPSVLARRDIEGYGKEPAIKCIVAARLPLERRGEISQAVFPLRQSRSRVIQEFPRRD